MTHKDMFDDTFPQDKQIGGSHYKKFKIDDSLSNQIWNTFLENVDLDVIKIMLHKEFSSKQMWQIKRGFLDGLSLRQIKEYAKPFYNQDEMAIYRYGLINNKTIKSIYNDMHVFNQLINEEVMSKERIQIIK